MVQKILNILQAGLIIERSTMESNKLTCGESRSANTAAAEEFLPKFQELVESEGYSVALHSVFRFK